MLTTILIIEDDAGLSELIKDKVKECGYASISVSSAGDALTWLTSYTPYIMLLDYTLPDMNAKEFIADLRRKEFKIPPFIISTGQGDERIAVDMMKLGARDYIVKDSLYLDMLPEILKRVDNEIENENKRREAENELLKLSVAVEQSPACIVITGVDGAIEYVNPKFTDLTGYTQEEAFGQNPRILKSGNTPESLYNELWGTITSGNVWHGNLQNAKKNGELYWESATIAPIVNSKGEIISFIAIKEDITQRILAEEKIKKLLEEKEMILKEVHHRIKNNMSTIKGLLYIQAEALNDQSAVAALRDAENRVESMMILYDKLYRSSDFKELSVREYLPVLADEIIRSFPNRGIVEIEKSIDEIILGADTLFPLGILINELLTNIMKYAFTGRNSGVITIIASIKNNHIVLIVGDNGNGMPESVTIEKSTGFGLDLVRMLTEQIGGTIRIERGNGTRFVLEFNV